MSVLGASCAVLDPENLSDSPKLAMGVGTPVAAAGETPNVGTANRDAADDPEIWADPSDPSRGAIFGTDKQSGLYVYDLTGAQTQFLGGGRLNNVDLRDGFTVGGKAQVLVGASNRDRKGISFFLLDPAILKATMTTCQEQYLSVMVLRGSDNSRYYQLKTDLANDMTKGTDNYPKTLVDTMRLITDYKVPPRLQRVQPGGETGVAFVQDGGGAKKTAGAENITCWHCSKTGHYKSDCPLLQDIDQEHGVQNLSIKECHEGHNLFSTDEGCILV